MKKKNNEPLTKVLLQVRLDIEKSAMCYYQLQFRQTNKALKNFLISSTKQSQATVPGWTS
jgi:hypothetical protein